MPLLKRAPRGSITPLAQGVRVLPGRRIMGSVRTVKSWVELPTRVASVRQRKAVIRNWVVGNQFLVDVPDTHSLMRSVDPGRGLKGIGAYDDLGHITRRIDVFGSDHYGLPTLHSTSWSWTADIRAPGGWLGTESRPEPATYLDKLLIFLLS